MRPELGARRERLERAECRQYEHEYDQADDDEHEKGERVNAHDQMVSHDRSMILDGAALDLALHGESTDPRRYLARFGYDAPPLDEVADAPPIDAEVNAGRWIWRCPNDAMTTDDQVLGGGVVFVDQPIGWCPSCSNADTSCAWRPLRLPAEREQIEAQLVVRPDPETRNWWPGETIEDLERENVEHGVGEGLG